MSDIVHFFLFNIEHVYKLEDRKSVYYEKYDKPYSLATMCGEPEGVGFPWEDPENGENQDK